MGGGGGGFVINIALHIQPRADYHQINSLVLVKSFSITQIELCVQSGY